MAHVMTLWRGEISLAKTGGLYGLVGLLLLVGPMTALASLCPSGAVTLLLALSVAVLLYSGFIAVAVWRSASKHQGGFAWRLLAKGSVVFVALQVFAGLTYG